MVVLPMLACMLARPLPTLGVICPCGCTAQGGGQQHVVSYEGHRNGVKGFEEQLGKQVCPGCGRCLGMQWPSLI